VKLFRLNFTPDRVQRFVAQLQSLINADLTHPAIVAPIAAGISGVDAYLAQDFVASDSADVAARQHGPAPPSDAVRVATQLATALDFAMDANVAHGSLHPRDIFVSPDDTRLTGLGIAEILERVGAAAPVRRPYTAPERIASHPWDYRADVFSLAAIIHELLWGRRIDALGEEAAAALTPIEGADLEALRLLFAAALHEDPSARLDSPLKFAEGLQRAIDTGASPHAGIAVPAAEPGFAGFYDLAGGEGPSPPSREVHRSLDYEPRLPLDTDSDEMRLSLDPDNSFPENALDVPIPTDIQGAVHTDDDAANEEVREDAFTRNVRDLPTSEAPRGRSVAPRGLDRGVDHRERGIDASMVGAAPATASQAMFGASGSALERTRSAVWPLTLALVVGLAVGFGIGYAVANRPRFESAEVQPAPTPAVTADEPRSVPETEVRMKPESSAPPVAAAAKPETPAPPIPSPARGTTAVPAPAGPRAGASAGPASARSEPSQRSGPPARAGSSERGLAIRSTPPGAVVLVDGQEVGRTPVTVQSLAPGSHIVRVSYEGFVAQERPVEISDARPSQTLTFGLEPSRSAGLPAPSPSPTPTPTTPTTLGRENGVLVVDSRPSGARVLIDGKLAGETPLVVSDVAAGVHAISIELAGYNRWTTSIRVVPGQKNRVAASLEQ
jgi:serine/threonine-protein kinase